MANRRFQGGTRFPRKRRNVRRGATAAFMALLLPVAVTLSAFAVNLSHMELSRTELYISTDAACRAAGRTLALTGDVETAKAAAREAASRNTVAGVPLKLDEADFTFGESTRSGTDNRYNFRPGPANANSVEVTGRRTRSSSNGPIRLAFPKVFSSSDFETEKMSRSTQVEVDVALVMDKSGSMAYGSTEPAAWPNMPSSAPPDWQFGDPAPPDSRWRDAVAAVNAFLKELADSPADENVGLCTYNSNAIIDRSLTSNYADVLAGMDPYTQQFDSGGTNIGGGILQGINALSEFGAVRPWASRVIVVLTDGKHNTGTWPVWAASRAGEDGIMVFSVTFSDEADQSLMIRVAEEGSGKHFHASTGGDLARVFEEIAKTLPTLLTQ